MEDKKYDDFFDEKTTEPSQEQQLMEMVDTIESGGDLEYRAGDSASGRVQSIGKEFIFVDIGLKNEGVIKKREFTDTTGAVTVSVGDTIEAFIVSTENDEIVLSRTLSGKKVRTKELLEAMNNQVPVDGRITGVNKGGFNVTVLGKKAFCPFSHIDLKFVDEPNTYLMKTLQFVITRVENRGKNIVLSRLPLLEKGLDAQIKGLEDGIESKLVIKGVISKVTDFGLFVDLGGIEGLVHISEISWERAENLSASYNPGQEVECVVLGVQRKEPLRNSKISLSMRMAGRNPWETIDQNLTTGSVVQGKVTRIVNFGAFVQVLPGIEGLIHVSEMSWDRKVRSPADVVSVGDTVEVSVLAIDRIKHSVSLSLKDVSENPWNAVPEKYPVGSKVKGVVASKAKYGYFIDLDEHITGLLANSNIHKESKVTFAAGDTVEVDVEEIDVENRRIALSYGLERAERQEIPAEYLAGKNESAKKTTSEFGAMLLAAMEKKK
jgi:small subunit ribosomal protein S1